MEGAPCLLDSFIWNSLHVSWAGCFHRHVTNHQGWPRCSGWLWRCSLPPSTWSLGKDKLESKNLEVCLVHDVDTADTSVLVQLAGISLEWRWVDQNVMRLSPTIKIIHLPLQTTQPSGFQGTRLVGREELTYEYSRSFSSYYNHGKLINWHSDLYHSLLNFC